MLQNNLLTILHLTTQHVFTVNIMKDHISFSQHGQLCFCATVQNGIGFLTRDTMLNSACALTASLPTIDCPLLHKRLVHIGQTHLERLLTEDMASGIHVNTNTEIP